MARSAHDPNNSLRELLRILTPRKDAVYVGSVKTEVVLTEKVVQAELKVYIDSLNEHDRVKAQLLLTQLHDNLLTAEPRQRLNRIFRAAMNRTRHADRTPQLRALLDNVGFFIPKSVREPFWRDMLDDCDDMNERGRSGLWIRSAIASQIALLVVIFLKDTLVKAAVGALKTLRG